MLLFVSISSIQAQISAGTFTVNGKTFVAFVDTYLFSDGGMSPNTINFLRNYF